MVADPVRGIARTTVPIRETPCVSASVIVVPVIFLSPPLVCVSGCRRKVPARPTFLGPSLPGILFGCAAGLCRRTPAASGLHRRTELTLGHRRIDLT
nr:hypothetical protein ISGA_10715 [Gordonia sp. NB41Y]